MPFWRRISQSKLKHLSYQFKRTYLQIPHASSLNNIAAHARTIIAEKQSCVAPKRASDFCNNVRFFAAPPQGKPAEKEKSRRMNGEITSPTIRLVTDEGNSIVPTIKALELARKLQLDLVEVNGLENPPVCKILDLKKLKKLQLAREKELKNKKKSDVTLRSDTKQVRFSRKIEQNDLKLKADQIKKLMERGYRVLVAAVVPEKIDLEDLELVKCENQHLKALVARFLVLVEDVATVEGEQWTSGRQITIVMRHKKFGPLKSGQKTKTVTVLDNSDPIEENPIPQVVSPLQEMPKGADADPPPSAAAAPPSPPLPANSSYNRAAAAAPPPPPLQANSSYNRAAAAAPPPPPPPPLPPNLSYNRAAAAAPPPPLPPNLSYNRAAAAAPPPPLPPNLSYNRAAAAVPPPPPPPPLPPNLSYKRATAAPPLPPHLPEHSSNRRAAAAPPPPLPSHSSVPKVENRYSKGADSNFVNRGARDSNTSRYEPQPRDSNQRRRWN